MEKEILPGNYGSIEVSKRRRGDTFRFDRSISVGNILTIIVILWSVYTGAKKVVTELRLTEIRTNIMWDHFVKEHQDLTNLEKVLGEY